MIEEQLEKISERLHKAIRIFADEFDGHLKYLGENIDRLSDGGFSDEELRAAVAHRFHTIRGGASFFQLASIRDASTEAEHLLGKDFDPESVDSLDREIRSRISTLENEFKKVSAFLSSRGL